jgi:hypothetical protein
MATPFPGIDPYLESSELWPPFQHALIDSFQTLVAAGLDYSCGSNSRYQSSTRERRYAGDSGASVVEEYIEIRQRAGTLITQIDVVSPLNRTTGAGRAAYLDTRRAGKEASGSLVEIDLVKAGPPMLDYSREGLPEWDYAVTVTRSTQPERYEIYTSTLAKRLPRFRLPLAADDRDIVMDLQATFTRAFEEGKFADKIDYCREPTVPLTTEQLRWLHDYLKWPTLSHEEIAAAAYEIWREEGCPHGQDQRHWKLASERLRRAGKDGSGTVTS